MSTNTMKGVGVVPEKKELRMVAHPEPKITAPNELKIRTIEIGICGTDREICTFAYGHGPAGCEGSSRGKASQPQSLSEMCAVAEFGKNLFSREARAVCCAPARAGVKPLRA